MDEKEETKMRVRKILDGLEWKKGVGAKGPYERASLRPLGIKGRLMFLSEAMNNLLQTYDDYNYWVLWTDVYRRPKSSHPPQF